MPLGSPTQWIVETFNAKANEDDIIKSRSLNITRISGVVAPILVGIATGLGEVKDTPPFNEVGFQRQLILAMIALIALVSVADILARSITSARSAAAASTVLPLGLEATKDCGVGQSDIEGQVVAFRTNNALGSPGDGEYLFVSTDGIASWERVASLAGVSA